MLIFSVLFQVFVCIPEGSNRPSAHLDPTSASFQFVGVAGARSLLTTCHCCALQQPSLVIANQQKFARAVDLHFPRVLRSPNSQLKASVLPHPTGEFGMEYEQHANATGDMRNTVGANDAPSPRSCINVLRRSCCTYSWQRTVLVESCGDCWLHMRCS